MNHKPRTRPASYCFHFFSCPDVELIPSSPHSVPSARPHPLAPTFHYCDKTVKHDLLLARATSNMTNGKVASDTQGQVSDVIPLLPIRGRPSKAAKKLALEIAERQQHQQQAQLTSDQHAVIISRSNVDTKLALSHPENPDKLSRISKAGRGSKRRAAAPVTKTVPGTACAAGSSTSPVSSHTSGSYNVKTSCASFSSVDAGGAEPEASDDEAQPSVKVEMQRTQPGGPVTKPKFVTKPEVPAGAPLSLGSRNADDAMSSVRMGQAALEQSALQAQGHIGAGDETAESVVQGVTNKRQAQSTEQELGKLATEVRKWELWDDNSHAEGSGYRDQLLQTAQLSIKADIVQKIRLRDSETSEQQVYCILVLAGAIVLAAFLMSPFAEWMADFMFWLLSLLG
ncbi:hypothetical protein DL546_004359 [Coniochaeta pulveracea]|uniref:Uncharacterized protein n=1 Tax=Coniochaeta pulveracea TaxID=177199 RepID=A0A420Y0R2_9PEZI|nr:hypothetical protein DL546_004359 [Coniochaeta pulveracea]